MKNLFHHLFLYSIILSSFLILAACSGGHQYRTMLNRADSLMTAHPDSAYAIITSIDSVSIHKQRKAVRMRYELLRAEAQNKLYIPFTTDSVLREVANCYNRHGSSNDRLRSRYLLGCAYRDLHEAPIALLTWEEAIDAADTTADDCDYATLSRVYGQMAEMYMWQRMPEKQLECERLFCKYSLAAGDTLASLRGRLHCNSAYYTLGDTAAILSNITDVRQRYLEQGLDKEAAKVYSSAIDIAVEKGQLGWARLMMNEYEQHSGLFDENGNIQKSRIRYYYVKGLYYLGIQEEDSAEKFFRRLLPDSLHAIDAYRGLFKLYQMKLAPDSSFKYGQLYETALARFVDGTKAEAIIQAQGMYDYSRQERLASDALRNSRTTLAVALIVGVLFVFAASCAFMYYLTRKHAAEQERQKLLSSYNQTKQKLEETRKDITVLRNASTKLQSLNKLLIEKEQKVERLENEMTFLVSQLDGSAFYNLASDKAKSDVIQLFHNKARPIVVKEGARSIVEAPLASEKEWNMLAEMMRIHYPEFHAFITEKNHFTTQKYRICILSRLNFDVCEMATLLQTSPTTISNARRLISMKLFKLSSSNSLNENLQKLK